MREQFLSQKPPMTQEEALRTIDGVIAQQDEILQMAEMLSNEMSHSVRSSAAKDLVDCSENWLAQAIFLDGLRLGMKIGALTILSKQTQRRVSFKQNKDRQSNGGVESGISRNAIAEAWRVPAKALAIELRATSRNKTSLASDIIKHWRSRTAPPSLSHMKRYVDDLLEKKAIAAFSKKTSSKSAHEVT